MTIDHDATFWLLSAPASSQRSRVMENQLPIRKAAKGIITLRDNPEQIVLVAGSRGIFGLPGGGVHRGETPHQAFYREIGEELGIEPAHLTEPYELFETEGKITTRHMRPTTAKWVVFLARLKVPFEQLQSPNRREVTKIAAVALEACLVEQDIHDLTKQAISQYVETPQAAQK